MTNITLASRLLPIAIGHALGALGFRLVIDQQGRRHLYWPLDSESPAAAALLGQSPDAIPLADHEWAGASKALVHLVRQMSLAELEMLFAAFAECEASCGFDFRLLSA